MFQRRSVVHTAFRAVDTLGLDVAQLLSMPKEARARVVKAAGARRVRRLWDEETEGSLLGTEQVGRNVAMMRDGMARGRAAAEEENAEIEAADDGVLMSREMLERDKARRARKSDSKLPPIV